MSEHHSKRYWRGLEERNQTPDYLGSIEEDRPQHPALLEEARDGESGVSRRGFLKASGFAIAGSLLAACTRAPVKKAIPYLIKPEEITPGKAYWYATTCHGCSARCGALAKVRDGRPIKLEGNPRHPVTRGGLCAVGQASVLELYDSQRLQGPLKAGKDISWSELDEEVTRQLDDLEGVYLLTGTITSPSTRAWIDQFLRRYNLAGHVEYDPVSYAAIREAHRATHGIGVLPRYLFNKADVIVSFGADFLGTWLSPVEFARDYAERRSPDPEHPEMSYHVQVETRMSLTGSNADRRIGVSPAGMRAVLVNLANALARRAGRSERFGEHPLPIPEEELKKLTDRLWNARGASLVVAEENDPAVQQVVNAINQVLGNYGHTLDLERPSYQWQGADQAFAGLLDQMEAGEVRGLITAGVNPAYSLPDAARFIQAVQRLDLTIAFSEYRDETARLAEYICPLPHSLETWDDAEATAGVISVTQPVIPRLGQTRTLRKTLATWTGDLTDDRRLLKNYWRERIYPRRLEEQTFQEFWDHAVHDGFVDVRPAASDLAEFDFSALTPIPFRDSKTGLSLVLHEKIGMRDGRHAYNPWLQEMPDPVTKVTWENYISLSPARAKTLEIEEGDVLRIRTGDSVLELPALIQPGQHDEAVAVALGYGRMGTDRFHDIGPRWISGRPTVREGDTIGANAFPLASRRNGFLTYRADITIEPTGDHIDLAKTQTHQTLTVPKAMGGKRRDIIHEATLEEYGEDPEAGNPPLEKVLQLWPNDFEYTGHHWGLAVDLNKCTGCSACLVSCQAENNVPVVGKDEVRRRREMHWLRIDRYYSGDPAAPEVVFQPVMCQQCDHAPCEPVCPVLATVHSEEGINQQIYNRCVGTRYCANNCPYKVRRFNWFKYDHGDERQRMVLNPDVTVRSRGVMEKCSFCIQRINEVKNRARAEGRPVQDGEIRLACQQSCPTDAIVFGDLNDPDSRIAQMTKRARHFRLLEEMNFRPTVGYLTKIRNRPATPEDSTHA